MSNIRYDHKVYSLVVPLEGFGNFNVTIYDNRIAFLHDLPWDDLAYGGNYDQMKQWVSCWILESHICPEELPRHKACLLPRYFDIARSYTGREIHVIGA